jgi:hypothetical protein
MWRDKKEAHWRQLPEREGSERLGIASSLTLAEQNEALKMNRTEEKAARR